MGSQMNRAGVAVLDVNLSGCDLESLVFVHGIIHIPLRTTPYAQHHIVPVPEVHVLLSLSLSLCQ